MGLMRMTPVPFAMKAANYRMASAGGQSLSVMVVPEQILGYLEPPLEKRGGDETNAPNPIQLLEQVLYTQVKGADISTACSPGDLNADIFDHWGKVEPSHAGEDLRYVKGIRELNIVVAPSSLFNHLCEFPDDKPVVICVEGDTTATNFLGP